MLLYIIIAYFSYKLQMLTNLDDKLNFRLKDYKGEKTNNYWCVESDYW